MIEAGATTSALLALAGLALLVVIIGRRRRPAAASAPITPGAALAPSYGGLPAYTGGAMLSPWEY